MSYPAKRGFADSGCRAACLLRQPAPGPDEASDVAQAEGDWDLVEGRLTLRYDDGGVEVHTLDSHHGRMAIVSGVLWERR